MYKVANHEYSSTMQFIVDLCEGALDSAKRAGAQNAPPPSRNKDKQAKIYAKVEQMRQDDVACITKVHALGDDSTDGLSWSFDEPGENVWVLYAPGRQNESYPYVFLITPEELVNGVREHLGHGPTTSMWSESHAMFSADLPWTWSGLDLRPWMVVFPSNLHAA